MKVRITLEVPVEVELYFEKGERGHYEGGQQITPDVADDLEVESFHVFVPKELTEEQESEALELGWKQIDSELNQKP